MGQRSILEILKAWALPASIALLVWSLIAWSAARILIVSAPLQHADAIVVLSGSSSFVERARYAAKLYDEGAASIVVLTNDGQQGSWSTYEQRNPLFYERSRAELLRNGVPPNAIIVIPKIVSSTYDESLLIRHYVLENRLKSILIVTSSYHSRRALRTFRGAFDASGCYVGIEPVPTVWEGFGPGTWWLHVKGWRGVAMEYPKLLYYWLRYP